MKRIKLLCFLHLPLLMLILPEQAMAQEVTLSPDVIASGGAYSENAGYSLSYTVGEMTMVTTLSSDEIILTQGFQQPDLVHKSVVAASGNVSLSPNPANDWFRLDYNFPHSGDLTFMVFDIRGRLVTQKVIPPYTVADAQESVTVSGVDWAAGVYVVRTVFTANDGSKYSYPYSQKLEIIH